MRTAKVFAAIECCKENEFGYGDVIYNSIHEFPKTISYKGKRYYRTRYSEMEFYDTGMTVCRYETIDPDDRDVRLYMDAAGHIWDEDILGIL